MCNALPRAADRPPLIRIVAVGSPIGDDAVGLAVGRRLQRIPPPGCDVRVRDRPGIGLLDDLDGVRAVLVIDAVRSGGRPGSIVTFDLQSLIRAKPSAGTSSHGLALHEALALAKALGRLPERVDLLGVEIGGDGVAIGLSAAIAAAIETLETRAREWAASARSSLASFP